MNTSRNNLSASRIELTVTVSAEEMRSYAQQAATRLSEQTTIEGFRPGKAPYETIVNRFGQMAVLEEASRIAVGKSLDKALAEQVTEDWVGQPQITVVKLAPDNDFEYKAVITLVPDVTLGEYKNLGIKRPEVVVSDEEIEKVITHLRESRVKETAAEREAQNADKVVLDIHMLLDKVPLENGQAKDLAVVLGTNYVVPGFDEKIIGAKRGEKREFEIHYPADHFQKQLAAKKVSFDVTVKDVFARELPELNDEFCAGFGLKNIEELRANIKSSLEHEKKHEAEHKFEHDVLEAVAKNATIGEIPETLIDGELDGMMHELEHNVQNSGGVFADYLMSINKTVDAMRQDLRPQALERVRASLVLRAIIKAENISVTEQEIDAEIESLKKRYGQDPKAMEVLATKAYRRQAEAVLLNRAVLSKLLADNS